jgi:hypothetical protein
MEFGESDQSDSLHMMLTISHHKTRCDTATLANIITNM